MHNRLIGGGAGESEDVRPLLAGIGTCAAAGAGDYHGVRIGVRGRVGRIGRIRDGIRGCAAASAAAITAATTASASADMEKVFGRRAHDDEPEVFRVTGDGEFGNAERFREGIAINARTVFLVGEESVAPAGLFEVYLAEVMRAGDAFVINRHFGVGGRNLELDGVVAVI